MGVGVGVVLLVLGAIIFFALETEIPFMETETLGVILMVAGVIAIILALVMNQQRSRTKHVDERRYDGPPPR
ncbi:MAG TPA: DUF6458 family protein [Nocardioidaceae bacterium]|nr:DUF6458 family protein [Nocardioidaceae bacterium]